MASAGRAATGGVRHPLTVFAPGGSGHRSVPASHPERVQEFVQAAAATIWNLGIATEDILQEVTINPVKARAAEGRR